MKPEPTVSQQLERLRVYLAKLQFVWSQGGCVLAEASRPVHGRVRK